MVFRLRNMLPDATLLLGVQMTASDIFHDTRHARRTGELINNAARKRWSLRLTLLLTDVL